MAQTRRGRSQRLPTFFRTLYGVQINCFPRLVDCVAAQQEESNDDVEEESNDVEVEEESDEC